MKYSAEKEQFQKVFEGTLKRRYKSIQSVTVDDKEFDNAFDNDSRLFALTFDVIIRWSVKKALEENESFGNLSTLGSELIYNMFKKRMVPWIKLKSEFDKT
mgnify:CR=1 FL=1